MEYKPRSIALLFRLPSLVLFFVVMLFCGTKSSAAEKWIYLKSENFEMISGESEKYSRELLVKMEQFRSMFFTMFHLRRTHEPRTTIVFFRNARVFKPYLPERGRNEASLAAYCTRSLFETYMALSDENIDESLETLLHEYVHAMLMPRFPWIPLWLNEGLAQVFSTFEIYKDKATLGAPLKSAFAYAYWETRYTNDLVPLKTFLRVDELSDYYRGSTKAGQFYSQSWAMVHYLVFGEKLGKTDAAWDLIAKTGEDGISPERAIEEAVGISSQKLWDDVVEYMRSGSFRKYFQTIPSASIRGKIIARKASELEVEYALLNLKWRVSKDSAGTTLRLIELIKQYPEDARLRAMFGELYAMDGNKRKAMDEWKAASKLGSEDALVYMLMARTQISRYRLGPDFRLPDEASAQLREWLEKTIELSPDFMEAYATLALVEGMSKKIRGKVVQRSIDNYMQISAQLPRMECLLGIATTLWRIKRYDESLQYVRAVLNSTEQKHEADRMALTMSFEQMQNFATQLKQAVERDKEKAAQQSTKKEG